METKAPAALTVISVAFFGTDSGFFAAIQIVAQVMAKKMGLPKTTMPMRIELASNRDTSMVSAKRMRPPLMAVPVTMIPFLILSFIF